MFIDFSFCVMLINSNRYLQLLFFSEFLLACTKKEESNIGKLCNGFIYYPTCLNKVKLQVKLHGGPDT